MHRAGSAFIFWVALSLGGQAAANADACSETWFYSSMAATGERDLSDYVDEGGSQLARSDFDLIVRNLDKAGASIDTCRQADTIAKYAFVDAQRWQIGFERGWVAAPDAARRMHAELQRLKAIRFDRRDKREYDVVQVQDKALYKKAGLAWDPVH
jgi:hypothetical protein